MRTASDCDHMMHISDPAFDCNAGLLHKKSQEGTQTTMEATLATQQTPQQREQVCSLNSTTPQFTPPLKLRTGAGDHPAANHTAADHTAKLPTQLPTQLPILTHLRTAGIASHASVTQSTCSGICSVMSASRSPHTHAQDESRLDVQR